MLELREVEVSYGNIRALRGVSLTVADGELVTLIGSNGAGKSTTLKTISGLLRAKAGSIQYQGQPINQLPPHRIVALGVSHCPEGRRVFGRLTAAENLRLGAAQRRDRQGVRGDLERVYGLFPVLQQRSNQMAGTLSGGEQQMLAIGRALMARPRVLMLDEPSLGLAPIIVKEIFRIIGEINQLGTTVLLVEQNTRQALALSRRGYVLENGRVVLEGSGADLLGNEHVKRAYLGM